MKEKIKNVLALILLVLLLPYVITVFMSGRLKVTGLIQSNESSYISIETGQGTREVGFEDYVAGITALQIPAGYGQEAVKAQVIIVRTSLKRKLMEEPDKLLNEKYLTQDKMEELGIREDILKACRDTAGEIMTYKGNPILSSYHAISAGRTRDGNEAFESSDYPYLAAVDSMGDLEAGRFLHVKVYTPGEILETIKEQYPDLKNKSSKKPLTEKKLADNLKIEDQDEAGYVRKVRAGDTFIPGEEFRNLMGLNSSCFTLEPVEGGIRIITKGLGHGVGLSQYGAQKMALEGKSAEDILHYYYKNVEIVKETEKTRN